MGSLGFQLLIDAPLSAAQNMQRDSELFLAAEQGNNSGILRFYDWDVRSLTFGHNQKEDVVHEYMRDHNLSSSTPCVRRPTGGGIVIHEPGSLTYSLIVPLSQLPHHSLLAVYREWSGRLCDCLRDVGLSCNLQKQDRLVYREKRITPVCTDFPAKYELVSGGAKIVGSAQKKGKNALLSQTQFFVSVERRDEMRNRIAEMFQSTLYSA